MTQRIIQVVKKHLQREKHTQLRLAELRAARKEHAATMLLPSLQALLFAERAYQQAYRVDSMYDAAIGELERTLGERHERDAQLLERKHA